MEQLTVDWERNVHFGADSTHGRDELNFLHGWSGSINDLNRMLHDGRIRIGTAGVSYSQQGVYISYYQKEDDPVESNTFISFVESE